MNDRAKLDWSAELKRFNLKYFAVNAPYLLATQGLSTFAALAQSYVFTNFSTQEIYGQYSFILSLIGIITLFSLPGINTAIIQSVAKGKDGTFWAGTKLRLKYAFLGSIALLATALIFYLTKQPKIVPAILITTIFFPFTNPLDTYQPFLNGKQKYGWLALLTCLRLAVPILVVICAVLFLNNLKAIVTASLGSASVLNLLFLLFTKSRFCNSNEVDEAGLTYGKHLSALSILANIEAYLDKIIIGMFFSYADVAIFSIGKMFNRQVKAIWGILYQLELPKLSAKSDRDAYNITLASLKYIALFFIVLCLLIIFLSPVIIPLLFTKQYKGSVLYAQLFMLLPILGVAGSQFETYLRSQMKSKQLYLLRLMFSLANLGLLPLFVWKLGILGILWSKMLATIGYSLYAWRLSKISVMK